VITRNLNGVVFRIYGNTASGAGIIRVASHYYGHPLWKTLFTKIAGLISPQPIILSYFIFQGFGIYKPSYGMRVFGLTENGTTRILSGSGDDGGER
jgi:hypothetical protein